MFLKEIKKYFTLFFESRINLKKYKNLYAGKSVLLVGDGISAAYAIDHFKKYDAIIACNNSINNIYLENTNLIFHIIMEPDLLKPGKHDEVRILWKEVHKLFPNTKLILNPFGRLFNYFARYKNTIYLSPYHRIKRDKKIIYNDFTSAFQATLGMALLCGFKKIDCVGFDAWLLTPKNNLRWYSNSTNPNNFDYELKSQVEEFIKSASSLAELTVFTYGYYKSVYSFIKERNIDNRIKPYIPGHDRDQLMRDNFRNRIAIIENRYYPNGYIVNK